MLATTSLWNDILDVVFNFDTHEKCSETEGIGLSTKSRVVFSWYAFHYIKIDFASAAKRKQISANVIKGHYSRADTVNP